MFKERSGGEASRGRDREGTLLEVLRVVCARPPAKLFTNTPLLLESGWTLDGRENERERERGH